MLYQCVESRSIQSFDFCLSHLSTYERKSSSSATRLPPSCEPLYVTNTFHSKQETFLYKYSLKWIFLPTKKAQYRTLLFGSTLLKHGSHFDYWNQPLNIDMRVKYLDCHKAWLCCYLVVYIENLLRPYQLLCFHLWPIYWLSLVDELIWYIIKSWNPDRLVVPMGMATLVPQTIWRLRKRLQGFWRNNVWTCRSRGAKYGRKWSGGWFILIRRVIDSPTPKAEMLWWTRNLFLHQRRILYIYNPVNQAGILSLLPQSKDHSAKE
jgi:hypothetical protein